MTDTIADRADEAGDVAVPAVDYTTFDADNHYYEATDAYTRHIDPAMAKRAMQWAEIDGRVRLLVGGRINRFIPNPHLRPGGARRQPRRVLPGPEPRGPGHALPVR